MHLAEARRRAMRMKPHAPRQCRRYAPMIRRGSAESLTETSRERPGDGPERLAQTGQSSSSRNADDLDERLAPRRLRRTRTGRAFLAALLTTNGGDSARDPAHQNHQGSERQRRHERILKEPVHMNTAAPAITPGPPGEGTDTRRATPRTPGWSCNPAGAPRTSTSRSPSASRRASGGTAWPTRRTRAC